MVYLCHANSGGFASIAYTNEGRDSDAMEHFDICRYWKDSIFVSRLPGHALRTLEVPVSSADAERAFSTYNKLVCSSRLSQSDESVRSSADKFVQQCSAAWNGDIIMLDLKAMTIKFYAVGKMSQCWPLSGNNKRVCM